MLCLNNDDSVKEHFKNLEILTVYGLYVFECIIYIKNQKVQLTLNNTHPYNTRGKNDILLPRHNLELFKKKTSYAGTKYLRELPKSIADIQDKIKFKQALREYLISNPLYSFEEFCFINDAI